MDKHMVNTDKKTLGKDFIENTKKELIKRRDQIVKDLQEIEGKDSDGSAKVKFPEYGDKADENAQEIGEYTTNLAQDKVLKTTLRDIDGALQRIKNGTYGECQYCKETIAEKRLIARPVASTCIACKTKLQSQI